MLTTYTTDYETNQLIQSMQNLSDSTVQNVCIRFQ